MFFSRNKSISLLSLNVILLSIQISIDKTKIPRFTDYVILSCYSRKRFILYLQNIFQLLFKSSRAKYYYAFIIKNKLYIVCF